MSVARGIKAFDEHSIQAVLIEFSQLDEKGAVEPFSPDEMTCQ